MTKNDKIIIGNLYTKKVLKEAISQKKVEEVPSNYMPDSDENLLSRLWKAAELGSESKEWKELASENPMYSKALLKLRDDWDELRVRLEYDWEDEYAATHNPPQNWDSYFKQREKEFSDALDRRRANPNR